MDKPNHLNFTKKALNNLPIPPSGKRYYYYDTKTRGLGIAVTPKGTKSFVLYRWINGGPERITIGRFPDLTLEQARGLAGDLNSRIAMGENPQDARRIKRQELTVKEFFAEYLERHARPYKKTWDQDEKLFDRYFSTLARKRLSNLKKLKIDKWHKDIRRDHGLYAANRSLTLLRAIFNKAIEWEMFKGDNPTRGIKMFRERSRERFLQSDELPAFFEALGSEPDDTFHDFVLISLLTGARQGNVLAMRWENINLEHAAWTIPETKSGESQTVPLVPRAVEILQAREEDADPEVPWVFPSPDGQGHLTKVKHPWTRLIKRAGIGDLRMHDLRRTLGSWQAAQGASLAIIGKSLAHKNVSTTLIYSRLNIDPVRDSMQKATDALLEAGGIVKEKEILKINNRMLK